MAVEDVVVNSTTGIDGNSYTTAISNDKLTNADFLKLLMEEMKMQDPTKPMDSKALMDSQLKMSTIEANADMSKSLAALTKSYAASSLSNAVGFMGKTIEDGTIDKETGKLNSFIVKTVESTDNEVFVNAKKILGYTQQLAYKEDGQEIPISYDRDGNIYDKDGNDTRLNVIVLSDGSLKTDGNSYIINDSDGKRVTDEEILSKYIISPKQTVYSDTVSKIAVINISKVYPN